MAKHNNKKQQRPNWFAQQRQKYGPDFMSVLNPKLMEQGAATIFKDMSRGKFDLSVDGPSFLNAQFIMTCIQLAKEKMQVHGVHILGCQARAMLHQYSMSHVIPDNDLMNICNQVRYQDQYSVEIANNTLNFDMKCYTAWSLIEQTMNQLQYTGDINVLIPLIQDLNRYYKYNLV